MRGLTRFWSDFPTLHKVYIGFISLVMVIALWLPLEDASASKQNDASTTSLKPGVRYDLSTLEVVPSSVENSQDSPTDTSEINQVLDSRVESTQVADVIEQEVESNAKIEWRTVKVEKNDNLAKIFERNKISAKTLLQVSQSGPAANTLINKLRPGQSIELGFLDDKFDRLMYPLSKFEFIEITPVENGYFAQQVTRAVDTKHAFAAAIIKSNFWNAGVQAGLNDTQIMNLANIFGWDVDFALDIREGDSFTVVYEELLVEGEHAGYGNILAAEFVNQGDAFTAIRHSDGNYYTPEGNSMRKAFLRAPVNFKYISSSFNPRRLHPVTGNVAPHRGIDYAARTGTPVVAAGDGKVIKSGYNSLNGNYVFIQHGKEYVTKYLHLHKRYVRTGAKVKQNQKIGTVGATGRVTGAHLHYEFLVNGVHRNPKTVKLPKALPIESNEKQEFMAIATNMMSLLQTNKNVLLAAN
ncbi:peptidoglycan DD-metalloendopeptidase family protein [Catenovulum sp. SX2]|uniref:peptidoglycan DD-metalloendopeptidase family protein n=1 Tax=Catenovulum sp. SX2 TaxID=3398614 RepID=UPI003F831060